MVQSKKSKFYEENSHKFFFQEFKENPHTSRDRYPQTSCNRNPQMSRDRYLQTCCNRYPQTSRDRNPQMS